MVATGSPIGRFILDLERVPDPGSEASGRRHLLRAPSVACPGNPGIVYDTALRGVHHQKILRGLGIVPVNTVTAAETFAGKSLKRKIKRREKKIRPVEMALPSPDPPPLATLQRAGDDLGGDLCQVFYRPGPGSSVGRARG
jgi:hypothetical protein